MQPTELLLIRHGETSWNAECRLQGHIDIALNEKGQQQAEALGAALAAERIDAVWSSDLQRAVETACAIAGRHALTVRIDPALRERCFGALEGLQPDDIERQYPDAYAAWRGRDETFVFPSGRHVAETLAAFAARVVHGLRHIASQHAGGRIAVVTHGGVLDCIHRQAYGVPQSDPSPVEKRNAGINRLSVQDGQFRIVTWCDVSHLGRPALDEVG